jgi:hypothetical protein
MSICLIIDIAMTFNTIKNMESKRAIVNVAIGSETSWYHDGQKRLRESLEQYDEKSDLHFQSYENPKHISPYADKIAAIYEAYKMGYTKILYLDCSIKAIRPLNDIWSYIDNNGYYLYQSGYNCAQTCNDHSLESYKVTRDEAEKMYECASNVFGIDCETAMGKDFIEQIFKSIETKAIYGIKFPSIEQRLEESQDDRFIHHRQDQSIISIVAGLNKLKMEREGHFVSRWENAQYTMNENIIFTLKGGY